MGKQKSNHAKQSNPDDLTDPVEVLNQTYSQYAVQNAATYNVIRTAPWNTDSKKCPVQVTDEENTIATFTFRGVVKDAQLGLLGTFTEGAPPEKTKQKLVICDEGTN